MTCVQGKADSKHRNDRLSQNLITSWFEIIIWVVLSSQSMRLRGISKRLTRQVGRLELYNYLSGQASEARYWHYIKARSWFILFVSLDNWSLALRNLHILTVTQLASLMTASPTLGRTTVLKPSAYLCPVFLRQVHSQIFFYSTLLSFSWLRRRSD